MRHPQRHLHRQLDIDTVPARPGPTATTSRRTGPRRLTRTATVLATVAVSCVGLSAAPAQATPADGRSAATGVVLVDGRGDVRADRWARRHHPAAVTALDVKKVSIAWNENRMLVKVKVAGLLPRQRYTQATILTLWSAGPQADEEDVMVNWGEVGGHPFTTMPGLGGELCQGATFTVNRQTEVCASASRTPACPRGAHCG